MEILAGVRSRFDGQSTSYVSLAPYREMLNDLPLVRNWIARQLPDTQAERDAIELNGLPGLPAATSENWRLDICSMFGIDPNTGASVAGTQGGANSVYLRVAGENIYVVPPDQPRRPYFDLDQTVSGWHQAFDAATVQLGGCPLPADAVPHFTGDRYAFCVKPDTNEAWTIYAMQPKAEERAVTTVELTGASSGGFVMEFDYLDNVNQSVQTFHTMAPVPVDCTAAQMKALIEQSRNATGAVMGAGRSAASPAVVTGGPLNVAPLRIEWIVVAANWTVAARAKDSTLDSGAPEFSYKAADPWSASRLSTVSHPSLSTGHQPAGRGSAAATGIDWLPMIIDWDEYKTAYEIGMAEGWDAPGSDLGHVIAMSIGNCGTGFVYPATRYDGTLSNPTGSRLKQGALITFRKDSDPSRVMSVCEAFMPIYNTGKRYGIIPIDKTGGGAELIFRNWGWYSDPGRPFPGPEAIRPFSPQRYRDLMKSLPWEDVQIIDPAAVQAGW